MLVEFSRGVLVNRNQIQTIYYSVPGVKDGRHQVTVTFLGGGQREAYMTPAQLDWLLTSMQVKLYEER